MTPTDKALLCAIRELRNASQRELANRIGVSPTFVYRRLLALQAQGLVEPWENGERRQYWLTDRVATGWVQGEPWVGVVT